MHRLSRALLLLVFLAEVASAGTSAHPRLLLASGGSESAEPSAEAGGGRATIDLALPSAGRSPTKLPAPFSIEAAVAATPTIEPMPQVGTIAPASLLPCPPSPDGGERSTRGPPRST